MNKIISFLLLCLISVGNCNYNYRNQIIKKAYKITRPLYVPHVSKSIINKLDKIGINHQAVKITTNTGKDYIISNNPKNGIHITDASLSNKWKIEKEIIIKSEKNIGNVLTNVNGFGNGITSYISTGTCIGTTNAVEKELTK